MVLTNTNTRVTIIVYYWYTSATSIMWLSTQDIGHILHTSVMSTLFLYCEVDASYLLHSDSKGYTGYYTISFYGTTGTFHNRSVKQTAVATS